MTRGITHEMNVFVKMVVFRSQFDSLETRAGSRFSPLKELLKVSVATTRILHKLGQIMPMYIVI